MMSDDQIIPPELRYCMICRHCGLDMRSSSQHALFCIVTDKPVRSRQSCEHFEYAGAGARFAVIIEREEEEKEKEAEEE